MHSAAAILSYGSSPTVALRVHVRVQLYTYTRYVCKYLAVYNNLRRYLRRYFLQEYENRYLGYCTRTRTCTVRVEYFRK